MRVRFVAAILSSALYAQTGVMSEWDVRAMLTGLEKDAQQLAPPLEQMRPDAWTAAGASPTYVTQWKAARNEVQYLLGSAQALNREPERLTLALDALFRLQALDRTLQSLVTATRKYQSAPLADGLQAKIGQSTVNRDKLRQYVTELAAQKEHEYQVMDSEAQRCRSALAGARTPAAQRRGQSAEQK